ncbi:MAG: TetR/AcrR family transcriptional regulator [Candidatus Bipolaricaulota bacterium]
MGKRVTGGRGEQTRAGIMEAALRLFSHSGYEHVSVTAIAQEAGVSRATVYRHFRDKHAILLALLGMWLDLMEWIRRTGEPMGRSPWDLLSEGGAQVIRGMLSAPVLLHAEVLFLHMSLTDEAARKGLAEAFEDARQAARDLVSLSPEDADVELVSILAVALLEGLLIQYLADPEHIDPEELWPRLIALCSQAGTPAQQAQDTGSTR